MARVLLVDLVYNTINRVAKELSGRYKYTGGEQDESGHVAVQLEHQVGRPDFRQTSVGFHRVQNTTDKLEADTHPRSHCSYLLSELCYQLLGPS